MENNKVVYIHRKLTDSTIFYVGIGNPSRAYREYGRSSYWKNTVKKHGYNVEVILKDLQWKEACEIEMYLIEKLGRKDLFTGSLVNMTKGGEGAQGRIMSEEHKRNFSERNKGNTYNLGKKRTEKTKAKQSEASKGKKKSEEHKKNLSKNSGQAKKIINTNTGVIYNSAIEASEALNINQYTLRNWLQGRVKNKSTLIYLK
mgnify:CR=1 FL=1